MPENWIRKQTLTNAERYTTDELKEMEDVILGAEDRLYNLEYAVFCELRDKIFGQMKRIQDTASVIAFLDMLASLAYVAEHNQYVRPTINHNGSITIKEGRHPVIEQMMTKDMFIANDTYLDDDTQLRYNDVRKFGRMKLVDKEGYKTLKPLNQLGKEPFEADVNEIYQRLKNKDTAIKTALLDQTLLAGIGNIYANEICYAMHLNPQTKAKALSKKRVKELIEVSSSILNEAIKQGGTTIHSFSANGIDGLFQVQLKVHMQEKCPQGHDIKKISLNGRGTYYCPICQKARR